MMVMATRKIMSINLSKVATNLGTLAFNAKNIKYTQNRKSTEHITNMSSTIVADKSILPKFFINATTVMHRPDKLVEIDNR